MHLLAAFAMALLTLMQAAHADPARDATLADLSAQAKQADPQPLNPSSRPMDT